VLTPSVSHEATTVLPEPTPASVTVPIVAADAKAMAYAEVPNTKASMRRFIQRSSFVVIPSAGKPGEFHRWTGRILNIPVENTIPLRVRRMRYHRLTIYALAGLAIGAWMLWLRPESVGGRAGYVIVSGRSMLPTLRGGDLAMVQRQSVYRIGDVVAYHIPDGVFRGRRIIHRIVGGDAAEGFVMRGDNNPDDDLWRPRASDIEGRLWKRLPMVGRAVAFARPPAVLAAVVGGFVFAFVMMWEQRSAPDDAESDNQLGGRAPGQGATESAVGEVEDAAV